LQSFQSFQSFQNNNVGYPHICAINKGPPLAGLFFMLRK